MRHLALILAVAACGGSKPETRPAPPPPTPVVVEPPAPQAERVAQLPTAEAEFLSDCRAQLATARSELEQLVAATGPRTVDTTLEMFNELSRNAGNAAERAGLWHEVHPDPKVRDAARTCEQEVQKFTSGLLLDRRVFDAVKAVDVSKADAETQRMAFLTLRDYQRAGVALDDAKRARIVVIDDETTKLGQEFEKNVAEDTRYLEVVDPAKLAGLPADWIAAHKPDASGVIKISTDYPDYIPFVAYAQDDQAKKDLYIKFRSRGDAHNEELLGKLLVLRMEKAKLLGFADWADYISGDKMLKGGAAASAFIERITKLAKPRAARDYAELLKQLKTHDPKAKVVQDWQKAMLETEVKKAKYQVDSSEVRKYFVYDKVLAGLLDITSTIYDIQYKPVTNANPWHPDVQVFDVMRGDAKLGRIFLDMHPRDGKYKHAAQFPIVDGVVGKQLPEGALVCNLADPKLSNPALMEHGDVVTMFHEFGHLMHHVLGGKHHWVRLSGVATEQDFVEAPSQMFEEWGWRYETLSRFAKHVDTGAVIPKELVDKMRKAEKFGIGTQTVQQMFYAAIALAFHQADPAKLDQLAMVKTMQAKYTPFAYVEGTKFHTSFGHLVGYSSMYYTYMWSLVIAKDLLTPFDKAGSLMAKDVTFRYRDKILAPGGSKDAADLVRDFLGRPYDFKAFEKYLSE
jgi:thimet oligopeptidase